MIEVDCRKCINCTGNECILFGKDADVATNKCAEDNFKNYVNQKKIDKAKEILENNKNIKVKQLSDMLGFNSVNTFIKVFGKYVGMSPGQYAKDISVKSEKI